MKKLLENKPAFITGTVLAFLDFAFISGPYVYWCATGNNRCGEFALAAILHFPLYLVTAPIPLAYSMTLNIFLFVITGLVQYFIIGYIVATLAQKLFKKS